MTHLCFPRSSFLFSFSGLCTLTFFQLRYKTNKQTKTGKNSFAIFVLIIKYIHIKYMHAYIHTLFVNAGWGWQPEADVDLSPNTKKSEFG